MRLNCEYPLDYLFLMPLKSLDYPFGHFLFCFWSCSNCIFFSDSHSDYPSNHKKSVAVIMFSFCFASFSFCIFRAPAKILVFSRSPQPATIMRELLISHSSLFQQNLWNYTFKLELFILYPSSIFMKQQKSVHFLCWFHGFHILYLIIGKSASNRCSLRIHSEIWFSSYTHKAADCHRIFCADQNKSQHNRHS